MRKSLRWGFLAVLSLACIMLLPFIVEAKSIYTSWHYSGDTFTVEGKVFLLKHNDFYDKTVVLFVDNQTFLIRNGTCKYTATREYCVQDLYTDISEAVHVKFENGKAYAGIYFSVNTLGADISVTRSFSKTNPEVDEEVTQTVQISNTGQFFPDDFIYTETFPSGVYLTSVSSGPKIEGSTVRYWPSLQPGMTNTFTYSFKLLREINFTSIAKWSYSYAGNTFIFNTSSVTLSVPITPKGYEYTASISPSSVEILEDTALKLEIENTADSRINVKSVELRIPSNDISLVPKDSSLKKSGNIYSWSGYLDDDMDKILEAKVRASKPGTYNLLVTTVIEDTDGKVRTDTRNLTFTASIKALSPILSISESSVSEGGNIRIAFSASNPNKNINLNNIEVTISSVLFPDMKALLDKIEPGLTKTIFIKDNLIAPSIDAAKNFDIIAKGTYDAGFGQLQNFTKTGTITITPVDEVLVISQVSSKSLVNPGENLTLTVRVRNKNQESIEVDVRDVAAEGVSLIAGKSQETLFFSQAEEKQAYIYTLVVPYDFKESEIVITSSANIKQKNYMATKVLKIPVNLSVGSMHESISDDNPEGQASEDSTQQKQQGFFGKLLSGIIKFSSDIVNSISDFFKDLFSKKE